MSTLTELIGKTFDLVTNTGVEIQFWGADEQYHLYHSQDCCESVGVEDVIGDLDDLSNSPITSAEEIDSSDAPKLGRDDSETWTFYRIATAKGTVTIRFYGSSNGYYSERVDFGEL